MPHSKIYEESMFQRNRVIIRSLDIILSVLILLFFLPVLIPIAAIKLLFDGWPLFYNSKRIGVEGELFTVFKFRTMINDQSAIVSYIQSQNRSGFEAIPLKAPIYTPIGRIFEKFQLVEMPQFFNVICGSMSLIGYRPLPKTLVSELIDELGNDLISKRHCRIPGITGLAQLKDKNRLSNHDRVILESSLNYFLNNERDLFRLILVYFAIIIDTIFFVLIKKPLLLNNVLLIVGVDKRFAT